MYSFFKRTRPPHHNCDPDGRWWLLMEDTHSSQYEYLASPVEPDPDQPSAYSLIGGGRPERRVRRRTTLQAAEPAGRTTLRGPTHETTVSATPTLRGEGAGEGAGGDGELSLEGLSPPRGAGGDLETVMA